MTLPRLVSGLLSLAGVAALGVAVACERRMHRHRQPGVSYARATFRKDGGWRREELFTAAGLRYQRKSARWGVTGTLLFAVGVAAWVVLGSRQLRMHRQALCDPLPATASRGGGRGELTR